MHICRRVGRFEIGLITYTPNAARRPFGVQVNSSAISAGVRGWRGICLYAIPAIGD